MNTKRIGIVTAASLALAGAFAPAAAGDAVYHTQHLNLQPVGGAPLRSGFVQNIKANGPVVYAHEIFVLNGARPEARYTVTRNLFPFDPYCSGKNGVSTEQVATLTTNGSGNARDDIFVRPEQVAGFEGVHGVKWTIDNRAGALVYRTACSKVTLD